MMTKTPPLPDEETIGRLAQELRRLHEEPDISLNISATAAWCLIIQIQLVGRHPSNNNWMYENVKHFAHQLESALQLSDWLKEYTDMGWNQELDIRVENTSSTAMGIEQIDYPLPDPAWEYHDAYHALYDAKADIQSVLEHMQEVEIANPDCDRMITHGVKSAITYLTKLLPPDEPT